MLCGLPFCDELSIAKPPLVFKGNRRGYSVGVIDSKDSSVQLTIRRPSIKDLLAEIKGF